jgi:hypothetical protein
MPELVAEVVHILFLELRPEVLRTFQDRMIELVAVQQDRQSTHYN